MTLNFAQLHANFLDKLFTEINISDPQFCRFTPQKCCKTFLWRPFFYSHYIGKHFHFLIGVKIFREENGLCAPTADCAFALF